MPTSCDTCRHCPTTYPSKGLKGKTVKQSPDFGWVGTCLHGHPVGILWEWETDHFVNETSMVRTNLTHTILEWDLIIRVQDASRFPTQPSFWILVGQEPMQVVEIDANTWRVIRGVGGEVVTHMVGETVFGTKIPVIRLYRSNTLGECSDWAVPVRVSRYARKWVI
jgi:hypothetical protein